MKPKLKTVQRWDSASFSAAKFEVTDQGLQATGSLSRSGVLDYELPDGSVRKEWRPPEEVFEPKSYQTLHNVPITVHHPDGGEVNSANYAKVNAGHVSSDVRPEGDEFLVGTVFIRDGGTVTLALNRSLTEFSPGYLCVLEFTPGVVPEGYPDAGKPYHCIQRRIKYNHVAFLPPGFGRSGPEVSLRLDSNGHQLGPTTKGTQMELTPEELAALKGLAALAPKLEALVGAPAPAAPAPAPAAPAAPAVVAPKVDAEPEAPAAPAAPADPPKEEEQRNDSALSPKEVERMVNDARDLSMKAVRVLGEEYDFTGKDNVRIMSDVIRHVDGKDTDPQGSEDFIRGQFVQALERHAEQQAASSDEAHRALRLRTDSKDEDDSYESSLDKNLSNASRRSAS